MDYNIAFDQDENSYRIYTDYEFAAIAEWVALYLTGKEDIQRVLMATTLAESEKETTKMKYGPFDVLINEEGVTVSRQVDWDSAAEEIKAMFDTQESFYQTSSDGVQAECGLEDFMDLLENWYDVLQ